MRERSGTIIGRAHICRNPPACDLTVRMSGCYGWADKLSFGQTNGTPAFSSFFADRPGCQAAGSWSKHRWRKRATRSGWEAPTDWCSRRERISKDHLPGAIHLGKGVIERDIEEHVPDLTTPMVLYCGGGYRSALTADNLQKMGYTNVLSMDGGVRGWREKGLPMSLRTEFGTWTKYLGNLIRLFFAPQHGIRCRR